MMYHMALFAHISGALIYFVGVGTTLIALRGLWRARTVAQLQVWLQIARGTQRLFQVATALILIAGVYMALTVWGVWTPWIDVALGALVVLSVLGPLVNGRRFKAIGMAMGAHIRAAAGDEITGDLRARIQDPVLRVSIHIMAAASLGIVFLMTIKPILLGSLATMAGAVVIGWLSTLPRGEQQRERMAVPASARV